MKFENVAVIIPCYNEEATIGGVITAIRLVLPSARIIVGDNNSNDKTADIALSEDVEVVREAIQGKAAMVRTLIRYADAEYYVMVDGDETYCLDNLKKHLVEVESDFVDMLIGQRVHASAKAYRRGHTLGNRILSSLFSNLMNYKIKDSLSGYRIMSRRFVRTLDIGVSGFEIEAELNAHAATLFAKVVERPVAYAERPVNSNSKLHTVKDGIRILRRVLQIFQRYKPLTAFGILSVPWLAVALGFIVSFQLSWEQGGVVKTQSLVAGVTSLLIGLQLITAGVVIKRITLVRSEQCRVNFLKMNQKIGLSE